MKALSPMLAFGIKFVAIFVFFMALLEISRGGAAERFVVEDCILVPATALIRAIDTRESVQLTGRVIQSSGSKLRVTRGCEGVEIFLILVAGILAFPAPWSMRWRGIGVGLVLAFALSLARLVALHFTLRYSPGAWEALHGLVLPLGPLALISIYFMAWCSKVSLELKADAA